VGVRQVAKPAERFPLPTGLKGKIQSLTYRSSARIGIPGTYSSAEVSFGADLECDPSDNPADLKTQLMAWVDQIVEITSQEKLAYWKEQLSRTKE
jgi:hypothetical protein